MIQKNETADNFEAISVDGPHPHANITITKNVLRREGVGIYVSGVVTGEVSHNDIDSTGAPAVFQSIGIGGGNVGLVVDSNSIIGGVPAISVNRGLRDPNDPDATNPNTNVGVVISRNRIRNSGSGINIRFPEADALPNLSHGLIYRNDAAAGTNNGSGIVITSGNNDNVLVGNRTTDNARYGIWLAAVPGLPTVSGTMAVGNTMLGNVGADVRDDARNQNTWIDNRCVTQIPPDANICEANPDAPAGTPSTGSFARSGDPAGTCRRPEPVAVPERALLRDGPERNRRVVLDHRHRPRRTPRHRLWLLSRTGTSLGMGRWPRVEGDGSACAARRSKAPTSIEFRYLRRGSLDSGGLGSQ